MPYRFIFLFDVELHLILYSNRFCLNPARWSCLFHVHSFRALNPTLKFICNSTEEFGNQNPKPFIRISLANLFYGNGKNPQNKMILHKMKSLGFWFPKKTAILFCIQGWLLFVAHFTRKSNSISKWFPISFFSHFLFIFKKLNKSYSRNKNLLCPWHLSDDDNFCSHFDWEKLSFSKCVVKKKSPVKAVIAHMKSVRALDTQKLLLSKWTWENYLCTKPCTISMA